ncbi:hypothetical protein S40288_06185 [Stachybotrys chartarum IBT 40288]|nr:hypothetical protein S40288_06185 [Stachybotrys chartarum IBT 40288]
MTHAPLLFSDAWHDPGSTEYSSTLLASLGTGTSPPIVYEARRVLADVNLQLGISPERRRVLLGQPGTPSADIVVRHTVQFVVRILRVWPRMLASYSTTDHLPPVIHTLQLADSVPVPLANCCTLVRMWADHSAQGSRMLVRNTIVEEVRRLLREHPSYTESDLVAAAQSLLLLLIILFFGIEPSPVLSHPLDAELLVQVWDVKQKLAVTGLFLEEEAEHRQPSSWYDWVMVSAKRRTVLGLNHLEWAWSITHGYPVLSCFELAPLPAPAARYLWYAADRPSWERLYREWLWKWKDGGPYKMAEFFGINPGGNLDLRSEMWLAEADDFGMILMAEVNAIDDT